MSSYNVTRPQWVKMRYNCISGQEKSAIDGSPEITILQDQEDEWGHIHQRNQGHNWDSPTAHSQNDDSGYTECTDESMYSHGSSVHEDILMRSTEPDLDNWRRLLSRSRIIRCDEALPAPAVEDDAELWSLMEWEGRTTEWIDQYHISHNAPVPYPTMHHFVTEMCTCVHNAPFCNRDVHFSVKNGTLWDICLMHYHGWPSTQPGSLHTALQRKYTQPCSLFSWGTAVWTMGARLCEQWGAAVCKCPAV